MRDRELTEQQQRFVIAFTSEPGCIGNASKSAAHAGYAEQYARDIGHQLLNKPHVAAAIEAAQRRQISGPHAAKAVEVLQRILADSDAPLKLQLDAAKTVLDRAGFVARAQEAEAPGKARGRADDMAVEELEAYVREGKAARLADAIPAGQA